MAFYKRLKEPSPWPHLFLCKSRNVLLRHGATVLPIAPLLPTLLRPGHASLGVLLLSGHEKDTISKKKQAGRKGRNKKIDTGAVDILLVALALMAPH